MSTASLPAPTLQAPSELSREVSGGSETLATATVKIKQPRGAEQCELQLLRHVTHLGTTVEALFGNNDCTCRACTPFLYFRNSGWCFMRSRHLHIVTSSTYGIVPVRPEGAGLYELQHLAAATTEQFSRRKQDLSTLQRDAIANFSRLWHSRGVATGSYPPGTPVVFEEMHWTTVARFLDHIFFFGAVGPFEFEWSKDDKKGPSAQLSHRRIDGTTATVCRIAMHPETCRDDERIALGTKRLGHVLSGMLEAFLYRYACRNCPEWSNSHTRVFQMVAQELEKKAWQLLSVPGIDLGRLNRLMCKVASIQRTSVHDLQRFGFLRAPSSGA
jgi:hypothetical protein